GSLTGRFGRAIGADTFVKSRFEFDAELARLAPYDSAAASGCTVFRKQKNEGVGYYFRVRHGNVHTSVRDVGQVALEAITTFHHQPRLAVHVVPLRLPLVSAHLASWIANPARSRRKIQLPLMLIAFTADDCSN